LPVEGAFEGMKLSGWGRYPVVDCRAQSFAGLAELRRCLADPGDLIVHAMGRSYGDSALQDRVLLSRRFNKILAFEPETGVVTCEAGVTLADLLEAFLPQGWLLPVIPGTKFISVGGAIASDVHGKNHHQVGCFSECLVAFDLLLPDGQVRRVSPTENRPLFLATCGGMGLTGIITTATLRLWQVKSAYIRETVRRCPNLQGVFEQIEAHPETSYSVAWIDCLSSGEHLGRSILMLGEHAESGPLQLPVPRPLTIPLELPAFVLNKHTVRLFNHLYYHSKPGLVVGRLTHLEDFFFPLDRIGHWNRMYGRQGFAQYQLVLPQEASLAGLTEILRRTAASGLGSFLGVLKLLGPANGNLLSFPRQGYTLALDFKIEKRLFPFLKELDRVVLDHDGRLYLAKDVRMSRETFRRGYPRWQEFAVLRESYGLQEKFNSQQSRRLGV
jgi:decaprenylphospho-beta-D-ribofuranose 2-oxidase